MCTKYLSSSEIWRRSSGSVQDQLQLLLSIFRSIWRMLHQIHDPLPKAPTVLSHSVGYKLKHESWRHGTVRQREPLPHTHSNPSVGWRLLFHSCCRVGSWPLWRILSESQSASVPPTAPASRSIHKKDALIIAVWIASCWCVGCQFHKDKWCAWVDSLHETVLLQAQSELG